MNSTDTADQKPTLGHPVHNEPAFILENVNDGTDNVLVIADLHFGIEYSLSKAGANLPSQTNKLTDRVIKLCKSTHTTRLVLLGDIKHTIPVTSHQEWHELPRVFSRLLETVEHIDIIPGNHDGNLHRLLPTDRQGLSFHPSSGVKLYGLGLFHGHTWPAAKILNAKQVLLAHNHPNVVFVDKLGGRAAYSCWVRGSLDLDRARERYSSLGDANPEIIVMPAFNDIGTGTPVNAPVPEFLGPMLSNRVIDIDNAHIYLLDGTDLGLLHEVVKLNLLSK